MHFELRTNLFAAFLVCAALAAGLPRQRSAPKLRRTHGHDPGGEGPPGPLASRRPSHSWFRHLESLPDREGKATGPSTMAASGEKIPRVSVAAGPPAAGCVDGDVELAKAGRFYVSGRLEVSRPNGGDLRDAADSGLSGVKGHTLQDSERVWERLQPVVKCRGDNMTLTVRRRGVGQLLLHPVNDSSVPLSQLPPQCGYSLRTTWRDVSLTARYGACHVTLEGDNYVLPLLWRGTPVKVSCPASRAELQRADPLTLCCAPYGVTVALHKVSAVEELGLNVRGEWTPLVTLAEQCGYAIERRDADIVITAPFITCGITVQDGKYSFSLQMRDDIFTLTCPVTPFEDHSFAGSPSGWGDAGSSSPPGVFPWTPPFYLAPPHYPHPVYRHVDQREILNNPHSLPTTSSAPRRTGRVARPSDSSQAEDQTYVSHQVSTAESQACKSVHGPPASETRTEDLIPLHPDRHQRRETSSEGQRAAQVLALDAAAPAQVDVPPLQPLTDAFSQYYHYYHNPKIPLSDPPREPNAAAEAASQAALRPSDPGAWLLGTQRSGDHARPLQYQHSSEYPYVERDEAKRFALHISETIPKPQFPVFPENFRLAAYESADEHHKNNWASFGSQPASQPGTHRPEFRQSLPSLEENPSPPPAIPDLSPRYSLPQQPQYYVLYRPYRQMYDPGSFVATDSHLLTSSQDPSRPLPLPRTLSSQASSLEKTQTTAGDHRPRGPLIPDFYRYHDYDISEANEDKQEAPQTGAANSKLEFSFPSSSGVQRRAAVSGSNRRPDAREELGVNGKALDETSGWQFFAAQEATAPVRPPEASKLNADPSIYMVPLRGCGGGQYVAVRLLEEPDVNSLHVVGSVSDHSDRLVADCRSTGSPGEVSLPVTTPARPQSSAEAATVQLRIATDESFRSFHPEAHLPLSLIRERPVYLEVVLAEPPAPDLVLLVHSCIAYTRSHWMAVYDGCSSGGGESWLLPSSQSDHIRRIVLSSFLSPPSDSAAAVAKGGHAHPEDPEISFLCLTEVCATAAGDCDQNCNNNPVTVMWSVK